MHWVEWYRRYVPIRGSSCQKGGECGISFFFFFSFFFVLPRKRNAQRQKKKDTKAHGCLVPGTSGAWDDPGKSMSAVRRVEQAREQALGGSLKGHVLGHLQGMSWHGRAVASAVASAAAAAQRRWSLVAAMDPKRRAGGALPLPGCRRACRRFLREMSPGLNLDADGDEPGTSHSSITLMPYAILELY